MKRGNYILIYFYWIFFLFHHAQTQTPINQKDHFSNCTQVLESNHKSLVLEFSFPSLKVNQQIHQGDEYQVVQIAGFGLTSEQGKPQLPVKGYLFGIPGDAETRLDIQDLDFITYENYEIYPAPKIWTKKDLPDKKGIPQKISAFSIDQTTYSTNSFYPGQIAQLGNPGFIRQQKVGRIQIYPVQYNPVTKEIRYYNQIKIKLTFSGKVEKIFSPNSSNDFDNLLRPLLLNYQTVKSWRSKSRPSHQSNSELRQQNLLPQGEWYKILTEEKGIYVVLKTALENAGLDLSNVDPRNIQIFHRGKEIPIRIRGEADGVFDDGNYIEFYGTKIKSEYTYTNVYWLTIADSNGLRMENKDGSLNGSSPVLTRSIENIHFEQNKRYETNIPNGEGEDHWFWDYIVAPNSLDFNVELYGVSDISADDCRFKIEIRGYSHTSVNPDHHTIISLNGNQISDHTFDGQIKFHSAVTFPQSYLNNGTNTISVNLPGDTGSSLDIVYVNWFDIQYWRDYIAQNDELSFWSEGEGTHQLKISNFSHSNLRLFDITDSTDTKRIKNFITELNGITGTYTLKFQDELSSKHRYIAVTLDKRKYPINVIKDTPAQLRATNNQADYVIIIHKDFINSITPLVNHRENQGLKTMVVNLTDVYDEFNYGIKNPKAIKNFLSYAYHNWVQPAPTYVLVVGDATYDYKDNFGTGLLDYMPTHLFESGSFSTETSSDNWFVCVSGEDILPDMFIGRLPVRTQAELEIMIDKIVNYETNPPENGWNKHTLFVADNADAGGDFEGLSDYFINTYMPTDFSSAKVYMRDFSSGEQANSAIIDTIDQGCLITNYLGHGSMDTWASEKMFVSEDVSRLSNRGKFPLLVTMSCINGFFHHPKEPYSLAEEFLIADNKGSIACFSPSGFGYTNADKILGDGLYSGLFHDFDQTVGSVVAKAKFAIFAAGNIYHDHIEFYNLLGDPALQMNLSPFTIDLAKDWNLISLPRQPIDHTLDSVLAPIADNWIQILTYENGSWRGAEAASDTSFWTLTELKLGQGYWLQMKVADQLPVTGKDKSAAIPLNQSWNLIGYPTINSQNIEYVFSSIAENWLKVNGFSNGNWNGADASLSQVYWTLNQLEPGYGYWLEMFLPDTLEISPVPGSPSPPLIALNQISSNELKNSHFSTSDPEAKRIKNKTVNQSNRGATAGTIPPIPSGFYGSIAINHEPAPVGTEVTAWINGINYSTNFIIDTKGQYGLIFINGNISSTPQIEGAVYGDTISFKTVTVNQDTMTSKTSAIWESGVIHRLDLDLNSTCSQIAPITMELRVDDKVVGEDIFDGDPISGESTISAILTGGENGINENSVRLLLNGQEIAKNQYLYIPEPDSPIPKVKIIYDSQNLADDDYELILEVSDLATQPNKTNINFSFIVSSSLRLKRVVNFPNPMQNDTKFTYQLFNDERAEVTIKIYTIAGRLIKVIESASGEIGYNETPWDGRDDYGAELANGVYFYKISAKDGNEKTEVIERLVVMR